MLVVEQQVALAVKHLCNGGGNDLVIVAPVPTIAMLPNVGGVVASLDVADVVDDSEQRVLVVAHGALVDI